MLTKKILVEYKKQNPRKFEDKYGALDPETLEGVIGYTEPTPEDIEKGAKRMPIWKQYSHAEIREMGGVQLLDANGNRVPNIIPRKAQTQTTIAIEKPVVTTEPVEPVMTEPAATTTEPDGDGQIQDPMIQA